MQMTKETFIKVFSHVGIKEHIELEFEKDYNSRQVMENLQHRLDALAERIKNAKILHDYDNYQSALDDYAYTTYKAGSQAPGYETKMNEMKQFFNRSGKGKEKPAPETDSPTA